MRRCVMVVLAGVLGWTSLAVAQDRPKVGVLKLTSSAPISTAVAAGQIDVGATGLTAATYNIVLGGETMWIVADKGREWPDHRLTAIVVQTELYDAGVRTIAALKGKRIGITQLGSTFHYQIGNVLEKEGMTLKDVTLVPLQAMPAALEALTTPCWRARMAPPTTRWWRSPRATPARRRR